MDGQVSNTPCPRPSCFGTHTTTSSGGRRSHPVLYLGSSLGHCWPRCRCQCLLALDPPFWLQTRHHSRISAIPRLVCAIDATGPDEPCPWRLPAAGTGADTGTATTHAIILDPWHRPILGDGWRGVPSDLPTGLSAWERWVWVRSHAWGDAWRDAWGTAWDDVWDTAWDDVWDDVWDDAWGDACPWGA